MRPLYLVLMMLWIQGCSAIMAAHGGKEYDYSLLQEGTSRETILASFGEPKSSKTGVGERIIDTYELEEGDKSRPGIAVAHLVMDLLTFGIWEIAGTAIEATEGKDVTYVITYGPDRKIISVYPPVSGAVPRPSSFGTPMPSSK